MRSVILPLAKPLLRSYLHHAYQTSILLNKPDRSMPWLLSNYIQLYSDGNEFSPVQFYMPDETNYTWNVACPLLESQILNRSMIARLNLNISELAIQAINEGYYIVTYVNDKYVPGKPSYQARDHSHMFFIYGYDLDERVFYHLGYHDNLFGTTKVDFSVFETAYYNNEGYIYNTHSRFMLYRMNEHFHYSFNVKEVIRQLKDLLYGNRQTKFDDDPVHLFGFGVYDYLVRIMERKIQNGEIVNIIPLYLLSEHKSLMGMRLEMLGKAGCLENAGHYRRLYANIERRFYTLRTKALRYNLTRNKETMDDIGQEMKRVKDEEMEILHEIVSLLEST